MQSELCATKQLARSARVLGKGGDAGDGIHIQAHLGDVEARRGLFRVSCSASSGASLQ